MRYLVATVLGFALMVFAVAQEANPIPLSLNDGVFGAEQAERGEAAYVSHCSVCHGLALAGGAGPALAGSRFLGTWEDSSLDRLYQYTKGNMPLDQAGTLSNETYLDILAHILNVNGFPAGEEDLIEDEELLSTIIITGEPLAP